MYLKDVPDDAVLCISTEDEDVFQWCPPWAVHVRLGAFDNKQRYVVFEAKFGEYQGDEA